MGALLDPFKLGVGRKLGERPGGRPLPAPRLGELPGRGAFLDEAGESDAGVGSWPGCWGRWGKEGRFIEALIGLHNPLVEAADPTSTLRSPRSELRPRFVKTPFSGPLSEGTGNPPSEG